MARKPWKYLRGAMHVNHGRLQLPVWQHKCGSEAAGMVMLAGSTAAQIPGARFCSVRLRRS